MLPYVRSLILLSLLAPLPAYCTVDRRQTSAYAAQFIIYNSCPGPIRLFIGSTLSARIQPGGNRTRFASDYTWPDLFFTDAAGGNADGSGTTRVGFYGEGYYYLVKDGNGPLNTAVSVVPRVLEHDGFCVPISCKTPDCATAFNSPPTDFPPSTWAAPTPPLYQCPTPNTTYTMTFCPDGSQLWSLLHKLPSPGIYECTEVSSNRTIDSDLAGRNLGDALKETIRFNSEFRYCTCNDRRGDSA
ncbi:hypothetical protein NMY22_g711 [Coprinellus aureogranulatus]|nr:hypothetical protein NMY22_g711 [Coprinellus aureogranulatus]